MRSLFSFILVLCATAMSAQTTPPSVVRSGYTTTQVDPYLTVLKRLGIPTVAGDSLVTSGTPQNSMKLIYNTVLGRLRVYNPLTSTWSDASPSGGDFIPLTGTEINKPVTGRIEFDWSEIEPFNAPYAYIDYDEGFVINSGSNFAQLQSTSLTLGDTSSQIYLYMQDSSMTYSTYSNIDKGFKGNRIYTISDSTFFVQKYHLDSAIAEVSISGEYLPLNIQDSTTVNLNDNALIFQGENHSLAINDKFDALSVLSAVIDGFRSTSYGDTYTFNGLIKSPLITGDTTRVPLMFLSKGLPYVDSLFDFTWLIPFYEDRDNYGFEITVENDEADRLMWIFSKNGFHLLQGEDEDTVFTIDPTTGVLTVTNEIIGDSHYPKTSPYSFAQMQDVTPNIITVNDSTYYIDPAVSSIITLNSGSKDIYLPDTPQSIGMSIYFINDSLDEFDINTFTGNNDIVVTGSTVSSISIPSNSTMTFINNGLYWVIF